VSERVQSSIPWPHNGFPVLAQLHLAVGVLHKVRNASRDHGRPQTALNDVVALFNVALSVWEYQVERALWALKLPPPKLPHQAWCQRNGALACRRLGSADGSIAVGALVNV